MKIGVDATSWLLPGGLGRHTRCLLPALRQVDDRNDYTFFTDHPEAVDALAALGTARLVHTSRSGRPEGTAPRSLALADAIMMSRALADSSIDLLLFPSTVSYVPVFSRARKLIAFHGASRRFFAEAPVGRRVRWTRAAKIAIARRQADAIAAVSDGSRLALVEEFGLDPARVHVLGSASAPGFQRLARVRPTAKLVSFGLTGARRMIVYVGGFRPHKNLPRLVEAFGHLAGRADCADVDLVMAGDYTSERSAAAYLDVRRRVETLALDSRVVLTGFLQDVDLVALLNLATVLVLPSTVTWFGLPALEAAACGCPVIATSESPLPDLLGAGALYVDPREPAELHHALHNVLTSPDRQAHMRRAGLETAARLAWPAMAKPWVALMERMVGAV